MAVANCTKTYIGFCAYFFQINFNLGVDFLKAIAYNRYCKQDIGFALEGKEGGYYDVFSI